MKEKVMINGKSYLLDVEQAKASGILEKEAGLPIINLPLNEDEVVILRHLLFHIGGSHAGARGVCEGIAKKLRDFNNKFGPFQTDYDLTHDAKRDCIYFAK